MQRTIRNSINKFSSAKLQIASSVAVAAILSFLPQHGLAAPLGGVTAIGSAEISTSGSVTTINQSSDRAVIDWTSFNLDSNETADFIVPSDTSATLNRITGGGVSTISGTVKSNGMVYFSNPNGLVFEATSRVSANGFIATTGTISNFDFMNSGKFSNLGSASVTLNGAVLASEIVAEAGSLTVGGNLSAGSGKIHLTSTNLTTIGAGAVISADGGGEGNGGNIMVWSDKHTDFLGSITAKGGTDSGDGGFVEVSGKATINFNGTVSTSAANGKTGTLLIDPSNIEVVTAVPASPTANVSYITAANLQTILSANNVELNANSPSVTTGITASPALANSGTGVITISAYAAPTNLTRNLTLTGSQIVIKASVSVYGSATLELNATGGGIWQDPGTVITANTLEATAYDGISLMGLNKIVKIATVINRGSAGVMIRNNQALTINAVNPTLTLNPVSISGGSGGVSIFAKGFDVTLGGAVTITGKFLRLDMGNKNLKSATVGAVTSQTLTANGMDVYFTSATTGNDATIAVGNSGSFTFVNDKRSVTSAMTLNNSSTATDWGSGIAFTAGTAASGVTPYSGGGLTVSTAGAADTINNQGVVYGGTVDIQGISTGAAKDLRYIEGTGVAVTVNSVPPITTIGSSFAGSLMLVSSGTGITVGTDTAGILVKANLNTSSTGDLTLLQTGSVTGSGILVSGAQLSSRGDLRLIQAGAVTGHGISLSSVNSTSASLSSTGDLTLRQLGTVGSSSDGIRLNATTATIQGSSSTIQVYLTAGNSSWVSIRTDSQKISLNDVDGFSVSGGMMRLDLGTGVITSAGGTIPNGGYRLKATGMGVYYTGPTSGHSAKIAVDSGSFTFVNDRRSVTADTALHYATIATSNAANAGPLEPHTIGWGAGPSFGNSGGDTTLGGLTITGSGGATKLQGLGVVYGGGVQLWGIGTTGQVANGANNLRYIEGTGVMVTVHPSGGGNETNGGSSFSGSLVLVSNGAGIRSGTSPSYNGKAGILVKVNLSTNNGGDLTLYQTGAVTPLLTTINTVLVTLSVTGSGIEIINLGGGNTSTVTAAGGLILTSAGSVASSGITVSQGQTLISNGKMVLTQSGSANNAVNTGQAGITVKATLTARGGDLSLTQSGRAVEYGINLESASLTSDGDIRVRQSGYATAAGIYLRTSTLQAAGSLAVEQTGVAAVYAIYDESSYLSAGRDLSLVQAGTVLTPTNGIWLEGSGQRLVAGKANLVTIKTKGQGLSLGTSGFAIVGERLRIDLGDNLLTSGYSLSADGMAVYFTGATTGNTGTIAVGSGSFTFVSNQSATINATTLNNSTTLIDLGLNGVTYGTTANSRTIAGMTVTGTNDAAIQGLGVAYGGAVTIQNISWGAVKNLNYIEGAGIAVTASSGFDGRLVLVSLGEQSFGTNFSAGISISAPLATRNRGDLSLYQLGMFSGSGVDSTVNVNAALNVTGNLTVVQSGMVTGRGIALGATVTVVGDIVLTQTGTAYGTGITIAGATTAGGNITVTQSGTTYGSGIGLSGSISAGGKIVLTQSGTAGQAGIFVTNSLRAGGSVTVTQSGSAGRDGIVIGGWAALANLQAGSDLSLIQSGTIGDGQSGINFTATSSGKGVGVSLSAGRSNFITLKTRNQKLSLNDADNFLVSTGNLRIDLGSAIMTSEGGDMLPTGGYSLKALGLAVYYTGATSGNNAKIDVGNGSFTFVNDKRATTTAITLTNSSTNADWGTGLGTLTLANGTATSGGLTLKTKGVLETISNQGVVYSTAVTINGVGNGNPAGAAASLRYIEGSTVSVSTTASIFSGSLALVGGSVSVTANLTTSNRGDLSLVQTGSAAASGISVSGATLTADGAMSLLQLGSAVGAGISATSANLTAGGVLTLFQSGTEGSVTVTQNTNDLVLMGSQIILAANLTVTGNLRLSATRGSVWQDSAKAITAKTLTGSAFDGFSLGGANKFTSLGAITNTGTAGVLVKNSQALTINAGTTIGGGSGGGVMILTTGYDLTLSGAVTVSGKYLRLDMGSGKLLGGATLTATSLDVYYTSAAAANSATIAVGSGSFTRVIDERSTTDDMFLYDATPDFTAPATAGLIVTGTGNLNGIGVVYGGTVSIDGVNSSATGNVKNLRYIEGTGVQVSSVAMENSLMLVSSGSGIQYGGAVIYTSGIAINGDLRSAGDLTLVQTGAVLDYGIHANGKLTAGGALTLTQLGSSSSAGIMTENASLTAAGNLIMAVSGTTGDTGIKNSASILTAGGGMTLIQSGMAIGSGIELAASTLTAHGNLSSVGNLVLSQTGTALGTGILVDSSFLSAGADLTLLQAGNAASDFLTLQFQSIRVRNSRLTAGADLSILQTGRILGSSSDGIVFDAAKSAVTLTAGFTGEVTVKTANKNLSLQSADKFVVNGSRLRIDLGSGKLTSLEGYTDNGVIISTVPTNGFSIKASGSAVYFTGATSGNKATLNLGATGSFTYVTDLRANSMTAVGGTALVLDGFAAGDSSGITLIGTHTTVKTGITAKAVTINAPAAGVNQSLSYIEGTTITVSGASTFTAGLVLHTTDGGSVSLAANLTTDGDLAIYSHGGSFTTTVNSTIALGSGTGVLIDLGGIGGGAYSDSGQTLTISNNNLTVLAGSYSLTAASSSIALGTGTFASVLGGGKDFVVNGSVLLGAGLGRIGQTYDRFIKSAKGITAQGVDPSAADLAKITAGTKKTSTTTSANTLVATGDIWLDRAVSYDFTSIVSTGGSIHFVGGASSFSGAVTLKAKNFVSYSVAGSDLTLAGDWTVSGSYLRLDVGGSNKILGNKAIQWSGGEVYYTSAAANNAVTLNLGKSEFVFVTDNRGMVESTTLDNSTALPTAFTPGNGLTINTTGSKTGQGVIFGSDVLINTISSTSPSSSLRYIEGTQITVTNGASEFSSSLTIVSNGTGIVSGINSGAGIEIFSDLSTLNGGNLTLVQTGSATYGINVNNATVTSTGGKLTLIQSGVSTSAGILLNRATLKAEDGDLSLLQGGTVGAGSAGISLVSGEFGGQLSGVILKAGVHSFVTLKTRNQDLELKSNDNFMVKGIGLRLDLGTGGITSVAETEADTVPSGGFGLNTVLNSYGQNFSGLDVYYTGATTGNNATIALGTGSFAFVTDLRGDATTTVGNSPFTLTGFTAGATSGLTLTGTTTTVKTGIVGNQVTVNGLTSGANQSLSYIEGNSVTVSGSASTFSGGVLLRATESSLSLGVNLTTVGDLKFNAGGMVLTSAVTTSGGAVTINLGKGSYVTGGFILTTSDKNLGLVADAILLPAAPQGSTNDQTIVFELGTGAIVVTGNAAAAITGGETGFYNYHATNGEHMGSSIDSDPNATDAIWKFHGGTKGPAAANTVWMNTTTLTEGKVVKKVSDLVIGNDGLDVRNRTGTIKFRVKGTVPTPATQINLQAGHDVVFVGVGTGAIPFSTTGLNNLPVAKSIAFDGANFFSGDLTLNTTGSITQTSGAGNTLSVTSGKLIVSGSSAITLTNTGNALGSLGALSSTGAIGITTSAGMILNGNITTTGNAATINLSATGLTLGSAVTTSGGNLTINLGTGAYATGGVILSTSNKNLDLTAGSVTGASSGITVFDLGTGTFTVTGTAKAGITRGTTEYYDYDPGNLVDHKGTTKRTTDPNAVGAKWGFNATGTVAAGTVWMNLQSLAAGKLVQDVGAIIIATAGLDDVPVAGKILFRGLGSVSGSVSDYSLDSTGHEISFDGVGTAGARATIADTIASSTNKASAIIFTGNNFFSGDLSLSATGTITQASGATLSITGGKLIVTGSSAITLNNSGNALGSLGALNSSGAIAITTGAGITLNGNITSGGAIGLTSLGVSIADSITVSGGDLTLTAGTGAITQESGKTLTIATGKKLIVISSNAVTLGNLGNSIDILGGLTSTGAITLATRNSLTVTANITAGNSAESTINLTATGMNLTAAIRSTSGGKVTIELGKGTYDAITAYAPPPNSTDTVGFSWMTGGKDVQLNVGDIKSGTGTLFDLLDSVTPTPNSGKLRTNYVLKDGFKGTNIYISNSWSDASRKAILVDNQDADFHTVDQLNTGIEAGDFAKTNSKGTDANGQVYYTGLVLFNSTARSFPNAKATITFWNVSSTEVNVPAVVLNRDRFAGTIVFAGSQNNFSKFNFATESTAKLFVSKNSILNGDIIIGETVLTFDQGATARSGSISSDPNNPALDLKLNFLGDFVQLSGDSKFTAGRNLVITSNGNSVRLMNRGNSVGTVANPGKLDVSTNGGNFQIASNSPLSFSKLETVGGWVVLDTAGSISGTDRWLSAGSVSFRAGGSVSLTGTFAAASGTGSSIVLNNSAAGSVLGRIRSDSSVNITGAGSSILAGDIIGSSAVAISTPTVVARDSSVASYGGRVEFARTVAALNALVGLRVDAGYGGIIALGGSIGSPALSLGWVELNGEISNTTSQGVFFTGGNRVLPNGGKVKNWRNGSEF